MSESRNCLHVLFVVAACVALYLTLTSEAFAKNVDLSTVPARESVQLTIYNEADLTFVRDRRVVTFTQGANPLQFSWANTLIDPTSVHLRFLTHADELEVLDTTFPHDKPQMLYWNVGSEFDGEVAVEISYFTSGIAWNADYVAIANEDESTLRLESYIRVTNQSGEDYEDAAVRVVVGRVNLVEAIRTLATRWLQRAGGTGGGGAKSDLGRSSGWEDYDFQVTDGAILGEMMSEASGAVFYGLEESESISGKTVSKESLSEYFIYAIEGRETIPNGWSKRLRSFDAKAAPVEVAYRYRPQEYGDRLVRLYLLTNDEASELGQTPLPPGPVRVFRQGEAGGLNYVATHHLQYVPIGDKIELNLGEDPDVTLEQRTQRVFRNEIAMQVRGVDVLQRIADDIRNPREVGRRGGAVAAIDVRSEVVGWDEHTVFGDRICNYSGKAIKVEIRRAFGGHILFRPLRDLAATLHDYQTVQFEGEFVPGARRSLYYTVVQKQGRNATQNNVTILP